MDRTVTHIPMYRRIADQLFQDIGSGAFPVGTKLPGEHDLRARYGVSRHTIREALRILEDQGVISRSKGIGTVVISTEVGEAYVHSIQSIDELLQYPHDTRFRPSGDDETVTIDAALSRALGIPEGAQWARFGGLRSRTETGEPICWTDVYVPSGFRYVKDRIGLDARPVYKVIAEALGDVVQEVEVEIGARILPVATAAMLDVPPGAPSVTVTRRYVGRDHGLFEVSVSEHPAERFTYAVHLQRGWQGEDT